MQDLLEQKGVDQAIAELLEAAGYIEVETFLSTPPEQVHDELEKANAMLNIVDNVPTIHQIVSLHDAIAEPGNTTPGAFSAVNVAEPSQTKSEETELVTERAQSTMAIPLAHDFLEKHAIDVTSLPKAQAVNPTAVAAQTPSVGVAKSSKIPSSVKLHSVTREAPVKRDVDKAKVKSLDEFRVSGSAVAPLERRDDNDHLRGAKKETNAGVDPNSEKFIRGVLHNDASRTFWGAVAYMVALFFFVCSFLPILFILFRKDQYMWGLLAPALFVLALLLYVMGARKSSCPVCRQRQFVPKACRKHVKAHASPFLGHMIPTAWHLLRYKWFRCIFCGTSIRVKE